jgi:hypothetical protein
VRLVGDAGRRRRGLVQREHRAPLHSNIWTNRYTSRRGWGPR